MEETVFSSLYILASLVDKLAIYAWVYFWALYFIPKIIYFYAQKTQSPSKTLPRFHALCIELYEIAMTVGQKSSKTGNFVRFHLILASEYKFYFEIMRGRNSRRMEFW